MIVKKGSSGKDVTYVQELLVRVGHLRADQVDGIAGNTTVEAIRNYQAAMGFSANDIDGIAGQKTIDSLESGTLAVIADSNKASAHFSFAEMTRSATASAHGLKNVPNEQEKRNIIYCATQLEKVREWLSKKAGKEIAIYVSSCFRSEKVNKLVGGSATSAHRYGLAIDFSAAGFGSPQAICAEIVAMQKAGIFVFDQLILEFPPTGWVHLGFRSANQVFRKQVLTAKKVNGKTVYSSGLQS